MVDDDDNDDDNDNLPGGGDVNPDVPHFPNPRVVTGIEQEHVEEDEIAGESGEACHDDASVGHKPLVEQSKDDQ